MNQRPWMRAVSSFVTVLIVAGAIYSGFFFFSTVRALVAQVPLPFADRVVQAADPVPTQVSGESPAETPQPVIVLPSPQRKLTEPVNILLLGIDQREGEPGPGAQIP